MDRYIEVYFDVYINQENVHLSVILWNITYLEYENYTNNLIICQIDLQVVHGDDGIWCALFDHLNNRDHKESCMDSKAVEEWYRRF